MAAPSLSRRAAIALPIAAGLSGRAIPAHAAADAEIIRLAAEVLAGHDECCRLIAPYFQCVAVRYPASVTARLDHLTQRHHSLVEQLSNLPATTAAGYRAKAQALLTWLAPGGDADAPEPGSDEHLVWSLCRDLCADHGREAA